MLQRQCRLLICENLKVCSTTFFSSSTNPVHVSTLASPWRQFLRLQTGSCALPPPPPKKMTQRGLVLGVYDPQRENSGSCRDEDVNGTPAFFEYNKKLGGGLARILTTTGYFDGKIKRGKTRVVHGMDETYGTIVLVGLGSRHAGFDEAEQLEEGRENIRIAAAAGVRQLQEFHIPEADMDLFGDDEAAAEGSHLQLFCYEDLKSSDKRKPPLVIRPLQSCGGWKGNGEWDRGVILADGQNYARTLMEMPANWKFPPLLAERIAKDLVCVPSISVTIRDEKWIQDKGMGALIAVSRGSNEPPRLVEIAYKGVTENKGSTCVDFHAAVVGKGVTFDTGGISLKPALNMDQMRGDMGGAAVSAAALLTAARLKLPVNLLAILPITENMPGGRATRPGDVVRAMNGKSIQIDNTDAEGRLILADTLCYAQESKPKFVVDIATLTGAIRIALGGAAAGVFTNSNKAWSLIADSSYKTGDRVWRMPLFKTYAEKMTDCHLADINNIGGGGAGGACTAAGFLSEFVQKDVKWMHIDMAGVNENKDDVPYLRKGFSGRPMRTLVEFLRRLGTEEV